MGLSWSQEPDRRKPTSVLGTPAKMLRESPGDCWGFASLKNGQGQKNQGLQADPARRPSQKTLRCVTWKSSPPSLALRGSLPHPGSPSSFLRTPRPRPQSGLHPESLGQASELEVVAEGAPAAVSSPSRANGTPEGAGCLCSDMLGPGPLLTHAFGFPALLLGGSQFGCWIWELGAGAEQRFL